MINDLIQVFGKYLEDDNVVINSYSLQNGLYFLYNKQGEYVDELEVNKDTEDTTQIYEYFQARDFYSNCFGANKCVPNKLSETYYDGEKEIEYKMAKKIFSNNLLTIFFKNKFVEGFNGKAETKDAMTIGFFKRGIVEYYNSILELEKTTDKKEKMILDSLKKIDKTLLLEQMKNVSSKIIDDVAQRVKSRKNIKSDTWIKIFIEEEVEEYKKQSEVYRMLKLFNKNDKNIEKENVYGLNDYNYGSNSKKPYFELKTTPYEMTLTSLKEEIVIKNLYTWILKNVANKPYVILPTNYDFKGDIPKASGNCFLISAVNDNNVAVIKDFAFIPNYSSKITRFECTDYLNEQSPLKDFYINTMSIDEMEQFVSQIWFSNYLKSSYYNYEDSVKKAKKLPIWKKQMLSKYGRIFKRLFIYQDASQFIQRLNEIGYKVTYNMLRDGMQSKKFFSAIESMNLWIALEEYYCRNNERSLKEMIKDVQERAKSVVQSNRKIEDDDVYFFLCGQVAYYLISKSKANKLNQDVLDPILQCNSIKKLKNSLMFLHKKYGHDINMNFVSFNNIFSQLLLKDETKTGEYKTMILAGALSPNLFYQSNKKEIGGNENGEEE